MSWADFDTDSALERDVLTRVLFVVPTESSGSGRVDLKAGRAHVEMTQRELAPGAIRHRQELIQTIRPLLFGAAWKVLDLLLEEAFLQANKTPDSRRGFRIETKRDHAKADVGHPAFLAIDVWSAITSTYDLTAELRHSLVHRRAFVDSSGALVGHDKDGRQLRPLSESEQEAFARAVLRLSEVVVKQAPDARVEIDLHNQLASLSPVHHVTFASSADSPEDIPEVTVTLDPVTLGTTTIYPFDVPKLRVLQSFKDSPYVDLIVEFRDRPGQMLRGRLEDAPEAIVVVDPDKPPDWLS